MNNKTEIAANLRHSADYPRDWMRRLDPRLGTAHNALHEMMRVTGCFDNHKATNLLTLFHRVANLIDPICHNFGGEDGTNGENYDFACSACGFCGDIAEPKYCPNCGARVVDDN